MKTRDESKEAFQESFVFEQEKQKCIGDGGAEELRLNLFQFWANIIQMSCHKKLSLKQFKIDKKGGQRDAVILKNYFGP